MRPSLRAFRRQQSWKNEFERLSYLYLWIFTGFDQRIKVDCSFNHVENVIIQVVQRINTQTQFQMRRHLYATFIGTVLNVMCSFPTNELIRLMIVYCL